MPKDNKKKLDDINQLVDNISMKETEKNLFITSIIAERIGEIARLSSGSKALTLLQLKRTREDIVLINSTLEKIQNEQIKAIKEAVRISAEDTYKTTQNILKQAKTTVELSPLKENKEVEKVIKEVQKEAVDSFKNEYKTQAFMLRDRKNPENLIPMKPSKAYQSAVDEATQAIKSGDNYTTVMRRTVKQLAESGVRVVTVRKDSTKTNKVEYESKQLKYHTQRLDTAIKRNVMDSVRMVNQAVQDEIGKQIDSDGVEITVHQYPAPDHAPVQGHQFSNEEFNKMQNGEDFTDVQGRYYSGFARPIGMWNCRHFTRPILVGIFPQTYDDEELEEILKENEKGYTLSNGKHLTMYKCKQKQNKYTTDIRYAKEGKITAEKAGDKKLADKFQAKVVQLIKEYKAFSKACGLPTNFKDIYVAGYKQ